MISLYRFKYREFVLTASNFGLVLKAISRKSYPASLYKTLLTKVNLNGVAAVRWGINNEQNAVNQFVLLTEMEVHQTGTHLFPNGILGASPDGLVGDDAVLEVKCPYKESTSNFLESAKNDMAARMNKKKNPYEFCLELKDEKLQLLQPKFISISTLLVTFAGFRAVRIVFGKGKR
jgi:hypothetical protein